MNQRKKNRKPKKRGGIARPTQPLTEPYGTPNTHEAKSRWSLVFLFIAIALGGVYLQRFLTFGPDIPIFTYRTVAEHPHDPESFSQGLVLADGHVWESTGKYGKSKLRKTELETGKVVQEIELDKEYFGEGLALANGKLYQLTWKAGKCFVYDLDFNKIGEHQYEGEGWGLTFNGTDLILSDGTSQLQFLDPDTFEVKRVVTVQHGRRRIPQLNELEFADGMLYASQLGSDYIYKINPSDGKVVGLIDLTGIWPTSERPKEGLLNGIAVDAQQRKVILTGKYCPRIFEVQFEEVSQ
ncbi:MAG: glutaminyl-peptide cyclotransferase [Planctomycetota bacterium]|nr:glutaminyl-peptide cyclotransferase [Planctomycetota bacterium]